MKVSIIKCENYEYQKVKNTILKSFELIGGIGEIVKPCDTVLLKVNVIIGFPRAATTHPVIVGAL